MLRRALDTAFQDLNALMRQAQDMVALAERFRATTRSHPSIRAVTKPLERNPSDEATN